LTQKQLEFCRKSSKTLIDLFGITADEDKLIDHRMQGNSAAKLKMLLSVYRRAGPLAQKQAEGKLSVEGEPSE